MPPEEVPCSMCDGTGVVDKQAFDPEFDRWYNDGTRPCPCCQADEPTQDRYDEDVDI